MRPLLLLVVVVLGALPSGLAEAQVVQSPDASTGSATAISQMGATFNGSVNPHGSATTYTFQYGTTTAYGSSTPAAGAGSGTSNTSVSRQVGALAAGTTYHVRIVATSPGGTATGADRVFTTAKPAKVAAPSASTGSFANVTQGTATVNGSINPNGAPRPIASTMGRRRRTALRQVK